MENNIFESSKISKAYFTLAVPLVLSLVITLVYNLADTWFVARTGNTDLVAGVSLGAPILTLLMALGNIYAQGGSSLISRLLGMNDKENVKRISSFCFYGALITGAIFTFLLLAFKPAILVLLGADADTMSYADEYYTWLAIGAPVNVASFVHSNLLRAEGLSKESMIGSVVGTVINMILDPIFIFSLQLGAAGAAIATDIGFLSTTVLLAIITHKKSPNLSLDLRKIKVSAAHLGSIFGIGIPAALVNVLASICVVITNQFLLPYGNDKIAAMGIVLKVSMIGVLVITGFSFGGGPLFGYFYGAGNKEKLRELFKFTFRFMIILALVISAGIFIASDLLMKVMIDNDSIVASGSLMLRCQIVTMTFVAIVMLSTIICQSTGKMGASFILSISRQGIVFFIALIVMEKIAGYNGIILAQAVADVISAALAIFLLVRSFSDILSTKKVAGPAPV